jgi:hypothetical protein
MKKIPLSENQAAKLSRVLCSKLGTPEGSSGWEPVGLYVSESSWRYRLPSAFPLLPGATRKMVTLQRREQHGKIAFAAFVHLCD